MGAVKSILIHPRYKMEYRVPNTCNNAAKNEGPCRLLSLSHAATEDRRRKAPLPWPPLTEDNVGCMLAQPRRDRVLGLGLPARGEGLHAVVGRYRKERYHALHE